MTLSEENYLKAIFHLEEEFTEEVSTNAIAEEMSTKASSATDMIKRLSGKGFLNYVPYQGVRLTDKGKKYAVEIIRKHRLWEFFLVEKLEFSWDEVHDIAEQLEHIKSEKLTNKLEEYLGYPKVDPHGDIIPDRYGNFDQIEQILLKDCLPESKGIFTGVADSSKSFLQYLDNQKISLGDSIKVISREEFDESYVIAVNGVEKRISKKIAQNLYLRLRS